MSDIKCVKCGEPWDAYPLDMLPWEATLFKAGAGCPSCEGVSNGWSLTSLSDIENGDGDPMDRLIAVESTVKWERPVDPTHWECDGCGVQVRADLDSGDLEYHVPYKSKAHGWYISHAFHRGTPEERPAHTFGDTRVCEFCLDHCTDCGTEITSHIDHGDVYDDGYSIPQPGSYTNSVCTDCFEKYCSECANTECSCEVEA